MIAAQGGHASICRRLLDAGASPLFTMGGLTARDLAELSGRADVATMLTMAMARASNPHQHTHLRR
jgi:hypothetical protein